jgi:hypothetical protein
VRKIISLGIATLLILTVVAVGTWATAPNGSQDQTAVSGLIGVRINPFEMMTNAKDSPVQQYDTH